MIMKSVRKLSLISQVLVVLGALFVKPTAAQTPRQTPTTLTSETPARIEPTNDGFDYIRRRAMIHVMNRPLRGPQNPTSVDHATDTL